MKEGWEYKKLGDIGIVVTGNTPSTKDDKNYLSDDVCFFKPGDIMEGKVTQLKESEFYISNYAYEKSRKLPKGSVLTTCIGIIGKIGVLIHEATCNQQINAIIPNESLISSMFLAYSILAKKQRLAFMANAPVVPILNKSQFSNLLIPVPPLPVQQRIVSHLDKINQIIDKLRDTLNVLNKAEQAIFYDMFGDPVENEKGWQVKTLNDIKDDKCTLSYGIVQPGVVIENGIPVVRPVDLNNDYVFIDNLKTIDKNISNQYKRTVLEGGEILFCVRGTTGTMSIASAELKGCNVTRGIVPISLKDYMEIWFVYYLLKSDSMQIMIKDKTYGIALKQINIKDLKLLPIILPPLSLQQSFASRIEVIEAQKQKIQTSIDKFQEMLDGTMDNYFGD